MLLGIYFVINKMSNLVKQVENVRFSILKYVDKIKYF